MEVMLGDLSYTDSVVDWLKTYDEKNLEPEFLPAALPILLINGSFGIGYAMRTDVPVHNINDVIDATIALLNDPNSEVVIKPDQCMPCEITDTNWKKICKTGYGSFTVKGIIDIENSGNSTFLVIKSTPDLVYLNSVVESINKLIKDKKILDIKEMYDDSSGDEFEDAKMRYVIQLKNGVDPNYVRSVIYANTQMRKSVRVNIEVLIDYKPTRMSYKSYLQSFIAFRKDTIFRLYCNRLQKVDTAYHRTEAFIKLLESGQIDDIIDMIKNRKTGTEAELITSVMKKLNITDMQASYIINASLKQLSPMHLQNFRKEAAKLINMRDEFEAKILDENLIIQEIHEQLLKYREKYGTPNRCKFIKESESTIPEGKFKVVITDNNFIKKIAATEHFGSFRNDTPKLSITIDNRDNLVIFDNKGRVFSLPVHKIPLCQKSSNGIDIRTLINKLTGDIISIFSNESILEMSKCATKHYIAMATVSGCIKKMDLEDFVNVPPSGIIAIKPADNDSIVNYKILHDKLHIVLISGNRALRLPLSEFPHQKRSTKGLNTTGFNTPIYSMDIVSKNTTELIVTTVNGKVARVPVQALPVSTRVKAPSKITSLAKGEDIFSVHLCGTTDVLSVITASGNYTYDVNEIKAGSSMSSGVKLVPLKNDNIVRTVIIHK